MPQGENGWRIGGNWLSAWAVQPVRRRVLLREAAALFAAAGLGTLAGACGPAQAPPAGGRKAQGKVVFMSQATGPAEEERYGPLLKQFGERYGPAIDVEWIPGGGAAASQQQKVITMVAGGTPPDAYWTHSYIGTTMAKLKIAADLNPLIRKDRDFKREHYFEAALKDYELDGKQYGLPREATTTVVVYNRTLFQQSGVPLPREGWTWDDYLRAARQLTRGEGAQKTWGAAGWPQGKAFAYYAFIRVWMEGGDLLSKDRSKFTMHQSPAVEGALAVGDLITRHRVHPYGADLGGGLKEMWNAGRLGMVTSISVYSTFKEAQFDWDIAHLPRAKQRVTRTASAGHSLVAGSKALEAGWELLKFLTSKSAFEHLARTGLQLPTYKEVASGPATLDPTRPPKGAKLALDAFAYARPEPVNGDWIAVHGAIGAAMESAYAGERDAKGALTAIVPVVEAALARQPASGK